MIIKTIYTLLYQVIDLCGLACTSNSKSTHAFLIDISKTANRLRTSVASLLSPLFLLMLYLNLNQHQNKLKNEAGGGQGATKNDFRNMDTQPRAPCGENPQNAAKSQVNVIKTWHGIRLIIKQSSITSHTQGAFTAFLPRPIHRGGIMGNSSHHSLVFPQK